MSEQMPSLLPCPFCGGVAAWGDGEQKQKYGNEQVYCADCYAIAAPEMTAEDAANNWNTRSVSPKTIRAAAEEICGPKNTCHVGCEANWQSRVERHVQIISKHLNARAEGKAPENPDDN